MIEQVCEGVVSDSMFSASSRIEVLMRAWEETGALPALREAVEALRLMAISSHDHASRLTANANLGAALQILCESDVEATYDTSLSYIQEALRIHGELVSALPAGAIGQRQQANLANAFRLHYDLTGDIESLSEGIGAARESIPKGSDTQIAAQRASALALLLVARYQRFGNVADADEAVSLLRGAINVKLDSGQLRRITSNLAHALLLRGSRLQRQGDLLEALTLAGESLVDAPAGMRTGLLTNAGLVAIECFRLTREGGYAADALVQLEEAAAQGGAPSDRSGQMLNVSLARRLYFEVSGDLDDLERSLEAGIRARELAVQETDQAAASAALGRTLWLRYLSLGRMADAQAAIAMRREVATDPTAPPSMRIDSARAAGDGSMIIGDFGAASHMYGIALDLLSYLGLLGIDRRSQEHEAARLSGLAEDAAAAALSRHDPEQALYELDRGRGVLWRQSLDLRAPFPAGTEGAGRRRHLRDELDRAVPYRDSALPERRLAEGC